MAGTKKRFEQPDEFLEFPKGSQAIVTVGEVTVGLSVQEAGWTWKEHIQPLVGGELCQAHHVGYVLSGRGAVAYPDGSSLEVGPGDVFDFPPGHTGWTIGDEALVTIELGGILAWAAAIRGEFERSLVTLLVTDIVDSTATARRLGPVSWRETLGRHNEAARRILERFRGREVKTTGDGFLATFATPSPAIRAAIAIREVAQAMGLPIRAGIHSGEVDLVGDDVRGLAVHEAARIAAAGEAGDILVSEAARMFLSGADFRLGERGRFTLKGIDGARTLYAYEGPAGTDAR